MTLLFILVYLLRFDPEVSGQENPQPNQTQRERILPEKLFKNHLTEEEKIYHLLNYVRHLQGSTFIRNGKEYSPEKAADHLESKYKKHIKRIKTAHEFVEGIATYSATKEPYQIRLQDGTILTCGELLRVELDKLEREHEH